MTFGTANGHWLPDLASGSGEPGSYQYQSDDISYKINNFFEPVLSKILEKYLSIFQFYGEND